MDDPSKPAASLPRSSPGYSARCKACNSRHRAEIDRRLLHGESARAVSAWLDDSHGERIPHQGLLNHKGEHLQVLDAAAAIVEAATPVFEAAVAKIVADASVLNEVAEHSLTVVRGLAQTMKDPNAKVSMAAAVVFNGALSNARAAVMDRHELLHGKKLQVSSTGESGATDPEAMHARLAALASEAAREPDASAARATDPRPAG